MLALMVLTLVAQSASRTMDPFREPFSLGIPLLVLLVLIGHVLAVTALIRSRRRDEDIA
jgi:hypothetical protein